MWGYLYRQLISNVDLLQIARKYIIPVKHREGTHRAGLNEHYAIQSINTSH